MYLKPTSVHTIPVNPSTLRGKEPQSLSANKHDFPGKNSNRKLVFLFNHAMGYHKEVFHPIMKRFLDQLRNQREYDQTDITFISWDDRHHGESARLNEGCLSDDHSTTDSALDTKQVIDFFDSKAKYDLFLGVGHSLGAKSLLLCDYYFPGTFNGLFLIEPVVYATMKEAMSIASVVAKNFRKRPEEWEKAEEFRESFLSKNIYKAFHPEVLELYANYGLYKTDKHTYKLKCTRRSEEVVFGNSFKDSYICSKAIGELTIPTQFILGTKSFFAASEFWKTSPKLNNNLFKKDVLKGTHLLPYEQPDAVIPYLMNLTNRVATTREKSFFKAMI
ncbi:alpha/beta hydrolase [Mucor ambiguus]|uniref:Alpha/beta hydrolase n=1 Tax=Mucor ambiguus TaxID=91626 RepID=A0A0C9M3Z0_9FUNG|nr:alpha/beta hydrolase [Mucor ambiguus]